MRDLLVVAEPLCCTPTWFDKVRKMSGMRGMQRWYKHICLIFVLAFLFAPLCITQTYGATLSVVMSGAGQGSVNSSPPGIACPGSCSGTFNTFSLIPNPDINSLFSGWGGACAGMENCALSLNGNMTVYAFFDQKSSPIKVSGSNYGALQAAYNDVASGGVVMVVAKDQAGDLNLDKDISFSLEGGFDDAFSTNAGSMTKLLGTVLVEKGSLTVKNLAIAQSVPAPPSAPTGLIAAAGNGQATITWNTVPGAASYNIYYATSAGVTRTSGTEVTGAVSGQAVSGLANGAAYYFVVTAVDANGESAESDQVIVVPAQPKVSISSLSATSAAPTSLLTITGAGFDPAATLTVSFFDNNGFKLDVPVLEAASTSIIVAVPPYISPSTGLLGPGTVNIKVIQNSGGNITNSNIIQNFQIQDLPASNAPPGAITLDLLNGIMDYYVQLQGSLKNTPLDIPELTTAIANNITNLQALATQIRAVAQNSSTSFSLGSVNGNNVSVGTQALLATDRMIIGLLKTLSGTTSSPSVLVATVDKTRSGATISLQTTIPCQQEALDYLDNLTNCKALDQCSTNGKKYDGYAGCSSGGLPVAVKLANEVIGGAGTAFTALLALAGAPASALALPAAALLNVEAMSITIQVDVAATLKNIDSAESYKAMHEAVDRIEDNLNSLIVGKIIPETAGNMKDLYSGLSSLYQAFDKTAALVPCTYTYSAWAACQPVNTQTRTVISTSPAGCVGTPVLSQSCTYIPPVTGDTYKGPFSGTTTEISGFATIVYDVSATVTISVSGSGTLIDPYNGTMKIEGTIAYTAIPIPPWTGGGSGSAPFSLAGTVSGSQFKVEGYNDYYDTFTGGTINGNTLTGTLSFNVGCQYTCADPIVKTIILTK